MTSQWLAENAIRIAVALFTALGGLGVFSIFLKKSWNQSVRLYQDKLVRCESREVSHLETIAAKDEAIAQRDEHIAFQEVRSEHREALMDDLLEELGLRRTASERMEFMTPPVTEPRKRSSSPPRS